MAEPKQVDPQFELNVIIGLRAMLGDQKARASMEILKSGDPEGFRRVMAEAEARYTALSDEAKRNPAQTLNALVATSVQLRTKLLFAGGLRGFIASLPRALRRFLWR